MSDKVRRPDKNKQPESEHEGERILRICNSCRYCEGYCAVFPAVERRQVFSEGDLDYLANLCHNCGECYYACQYAPPHEFAVNVPKVLAEIRAQSWRRYAWPFWLNGFVIALLAAGLAVALRPNLAAPQTPGDFYRVIPHVAMVRLFGALSVVVLAIWLAGFLRFWRASGERVSAIFNEPAWRRALTDALMLRYLDGGGGGCSYPEEQQSQSRRRFHHLVFYGFLLCFASTTTAAFYHYALGRRAPYGYFSAPVLLGTIGGAGILLGCLRLFALRSRRNPDLQPAFRMSELTFPVLLLLSSVSGLLLLAFRNTPYMSEFLAGHLVIVLALFVTLPYGKFLHAVYRFGALLKYTLENQRRA